MNSDKLSKDEEIINEDPTLEDDGDEEEDEDEEVFLGYLAEDDKIKDELAESQPWKPDGAKLGGAPVFSPSLDATALTTCLESLKCKTCGQRLVFVLQMASPIDELAADRVLYVFTCARKEKVCSSRDWVIIRALSPPVVQEKLDKKDEPFAVDDEWGSDPTSEVAVEETKGSKSETIATLASEFSGWIPHFVTVVEEPPPDANPTDAKKDADLLRMHAVSVDAGDQGTNGLDGAVNEEQLARVAFGGDQATWRFFRRLRRMPQQVIRYSFAGEPLPNAKHPEVKTHQCTVCGSLQVFEFQLMPALIHFLASMSSLSGPEESNMVELDFGTVLFFNCSKNCGGLNWIGRQTSSFMVMIDPDTSLLANSELVS